MRPTLQTSYAILLQGMEALAKVMPEMTELEAMQQVGAGDLPVRCIPSSFLSQPSPLVLTPASRTYMQEDPAAYEDLMARADAVEAAAAAAVEFLDFGLDDGGRATAGRCGSGGQTQLAALSIPDG